MNCTKCGGTGIIPSALSVMPNSTQTCLVCGGTGEVKAKTMIVFDGKKYATQFKPGDQVQVVAMTRLGAGSYGVVRQVGYDPDREQIMYEVALMNGVRGLYKAGELFKIERSGAAGESE